MPTESADGGERQHFAEWVRKAMIRSNYQHEGVIQVSLFYIDLANVAIGMALTYVGAFLFAER